MNTTLISRVPTRTFQHSLHFPLASAQLQGVLGHLHSYVKIKNQSQHYCPRISTNKLWSSRSYSSRSHPSSNSNTFQQPIKIRAKEENLENATDLEPTTAWDSYDANAATEALFKECARQADYIIPQAFERSGVIPKNLDGEDVGEGVGYWYEYFGLVPTFGNWAQVTMLHMYLFTVRMRYFPPQHAEKWMQLFHDHFFYEAEHRMNLFHNITSRMVRNRHLKDLYNQWRGVQGAYDEGLVKGDAVLGAAVWRNIFKADGQMNWKKVALVVSFMRRGLQRLDRTKDQTILTASLQFGNPMQELSIVQRASPQKAFMFSENNNGKLPIQETRT